VKSIIKLFFLLLVVIFVSSIFKGGDYIRTIGDISGINLETLADVADSMRLGNFMSEKQNEMRQKESSTLNN
jgi:hypothetical protein